MNIPTIPANPYLLLTPGPLSTSKKVKAAMLRDLCTWDDDYNEEVVQFIRWKLVLLATIGTDKYTSVLMQGSGTFSVEAVFSSVISDDDNVLIISNGAYGKRMQAIASRLKLNYYLYEVPENTVPDIEKIEEILNSNERVTHVAAVHCETTSGILNPVKEIFQCAKKYGKITIVDAMSSFGGIPMDVDEWKIDYLISSANKCIQGVPGFGFVIARKDLVEKSKGIARSLSLDLYDQWITMEKGNGKWRFTSPTHVVRAFKQALIELDEEGGISARHKRYRKNQQILMNGMRKMHFISLVPPEHQSPIITSFLSPAAKDYDFDTFYKRLKKNGFVIYPGKITEQDTFRIGNIGEVYTHDIDRLLEVIACNRFW